MYCISCKKDRVHPYDYKYPSKDDLPNEVDMLWEKKPSNHIDGTPYNISINNSMVDNGIIHIIDAGYGSVHDGDKIIIAICDDCISSNLEDSTLLYYGNYMFDGEYIDGCVEKSKKLYQRRKNLDELT